jgi:putative sigma-54 modulation protein
MDLNIQSIHFTADSKLVDFISKKLEKLETYDDKIITADVFLKLDSHQKVKDKVVDIKVNVPGNTLFSSETTKSFEESADLAVENLRRQLMKRKTKMA